MNGVVKRGCCTVKEIAAEGVVVVNEAGEEELIGADTVVTAFGVTLFGEKLNPRKLLALGLIIGGIVVSGL